MKIETYCTCKIQKQYTPIIEPDFISYFLDNKNIVRNDEEKILHHMEQVKCELNYYIRHKDVQWYLGHASADRYNAH